MRSKPQFKNIPANAKVAVILFGTLGIMGIVRAAQDITAMPSGYLALLVFLALVTAHTKVRLVGGSSLSLLTTVALVAVMMLGTKAAVLVGACGVIAQCAIPFRRFIPHHLVFNLGMIVLTISIAGEGYYTAVRGPDPTATDQFVGSLIASLLYYIGNSVCVSLVVALSGNKSIFRVWHDHFLYTAPSFVLAGFLGSIVAQSAATFTAAVPLVVVPILYLCYYSYSVYLRSLENEKKHADEMAELFNSTVSTLALAIDAKDKNTHGHIQRVQKYSRAIAEAMRLDEEQIRSIAAAALLHDIGKLAIPEYILSKHGPLTPEEMRKMRLHPQLGADIISNIKFPYPVADSILAHHERFDGKGYPNGLAGNAIPLGARVLAVADVFDAYTSDRIECKETMESAIKEIKAGAGTFFDPEVVAVWESIYLQVVAWNSNNASSAAYTNIQRATSELKMLESLAESLSSLTAVDEMNTVVCRLLADSIPGCTAELMLGEQKGIPVEFEGKVIGTIVVDRPTAALTEDEARLVTAMCEKIAGPLAKAVALETARREATVDNLTGLANRRAFEMMSATLDAKGCSVVLVDVNSFKAVNDNFGHQAGDAALIHIAAHLQAAFHKARLICRLGGDEFLVLSFESRRDLRMQIRNFRRMVIWDPAHQPYRKLLFGVSCGLATIPHDAATIEQAVQTADERMYAVKTHFKQFVSREATVSVR